MPVYKKVATGRSKKSSRYQFLSGASAPVEWLHLVATVLVGFVQYNFDCNPLVLVRVQGGELVQYRTVLDCPTFCTSTSTRNESLTVRRSAVRYCT